ncbi:MAG: polysaccharide pyruvyl transferase family protein, partial [Opitutus sp.]
MEWAPDTAFAFDIRDDRRADEYLATAGLDRGKFLCCISRFRNTPFWEIPSKHVAIDATKHARNMAMKASDAAPLLEAIIAVARETSLKILLCPEDETQMAITREMLWNPLPEDVRSKVVLRETFWLPDEAVSVYERSVGLFGHEMHSPIMCIGRGIPAIVCRWAEQSSKGTMWRNIGLGDWLFDLDLPEETSRVAPAVLAMAKDPEGSRTRARQARAIVRARFQTVMGTVVQAVA